MGLCLMAASLPEFATPIIGILMAAAGLGFVIFVHELGHFAVARACGVKCDKFMVGFDFWGLKLSRKWGETEYGIGVFPLGGYVKMMGQDDDPNRAAEQFEEATVEEGSEFAKEVTAPDGTKKYLDRRSYQAKSVPQRMAIISAGVIMNVIFAWVFAFFAYGLGVQYLPCVISGVSPGGPAWQAGLEVGDEIVQIGDRTNPDFDHLTAGVTLGNSGEGVDFRIKRAATGEVEELTLIPVKMDGSPKIGVGYPRAASIKPLKEEALAEAVKLVGLPDFAPKDKIIAADGEPIETYRDLSLALAAKPDEAIVLTVQGAAKPNSEGEAATRELTLAPMPAMRLGLVMTMGPIAAIQAGSPAAEAGLKAGDTLVAIDGETIGGDGLNPADLDAVLQGKTGAVDLTYRPAGGESDQTASVTPRPATGSSMPGAKGSPMPLEALGIAYKIVPEVSAVTPGSPAEAAGLKVGDSVTKVTPAIADGKGELKAEGTRELGEKGWGWPPVLTLIEQLTPGSKVTLTVSRGDEQKTFELSPEPSETAYIADRQLVNVLDLRLEDRDASTIGEQASLALDKTWFSLTHVVRVLQKLVSRDVPVKNLSGPFGILEMSVSAASTSTSQFLLFLTLISANLAVLNFLPIPVLDGGHMVFLAWEGITGRPPNERVMIALQLVGMALLLSLMLFVTFNDVVRMFFR
ncbi:MAG: site-2 protease family protein [Planctomycetota bacterium]